MSLLDALVIGGGPAGATTALLLARNGWRVALVEKTRFPRRKVCGEFLSASNQPILQELGLADSIAGLAGPEVRQLGLMARDLMVVADMPAPKATSQPWGRACRREVLDTILLEAAAHAGVRIFQPAAAIAWTRKADDFACRIASKQASLDVRSRVLIAAHGSWDRGALPTQPKSASEQPSDLLAFKAHFRQSKLPPGLMPLLAFPGGYGGMVHCDEDRISLSCCIGRHQLQRCRALHPGQPAPQAVLDHILQSCAGARDFLDSAQLDQTWLSAGPIRPGIRNCGNDGLFLVGNVAGEAHPVIAEGISMALQSGWLLARCLAEKPDVLSSRDALRHVHADYSQAWKILPGLEKKLCRPDPLFGGRIPVGDPPAACGGDRSGLAPVSSHPDAGRTPEWKGSPFKHFFEDLPKHTTIQLTDCTKASHRFRDDPRDAILGAPAEVTGFGFIRK